MNLPIVCTNAAEFQGRLTRFQGEMCPEPGRGLFPDGERTQGGVSNATTIFGNACVQAFADLQGTPPLLDIVARATRVLSVIIESHVFHNGNGRTGMYALYLFLACWGYRLRVPPMALHAYLMGESQRAALPDDMGERVPVFCVPLATQSQGWSLALRLERKLKALEKTRGIAQRLSNNRPARGKVSLKTGAQLFQISGKSALSHVTEVQAYVTDRAAARRRAKERMDAENELKRSLIQLCNNHGSPFTAKVIGKTVQEQTKVLGRLPTIDEMKLKFGLEDVPEQ